MKRLLIFLLLIVVIVIVRRYVFAAEPEPSAPDPIETALEEPPERITVEDILATLETFIEEKQAYNETILALGQDMQTSMEEATEKLRNIPTMLMWLIVICTFQAGLMIFILFAIPWGKS